MRQKITIVTNRSKDPDLTMTKHIQERLVQGNAEVRIMDQEDTDVALAAAITKDVKPDMVLVLGGDGTLLRAAKGLAGSNIPVLGINLGTLGYLTEVEPGGVDEALARLLDGNFSLEQRMMLTGEILRAGSDMVEYRADALNDVAVTRSGSLQLLRYRVWVNGQILNSCGADGIIIATPTGSTGYNMSAGGPIVEPGAELILVTPICPHTLNTRGIVLKQEDEVCVEILANPGPEQPSVEVSFDGGRQIRLQKGDRIRVRKSDQTTSIIKLSKQSFLMRLHRKMDSGMEN